jgi:hypothetical protein
MYIILNTKGFASAIVYSNSNDCTGDYYVQPFPSICTTTNSLNKNISSLVACYSNNTLLPTSIPSIDVSTVIDDFYSNISITNALSSTISSIDEIVIEETTAIAMNTSSAFLTFVNGFTYPGQDVTPTVEALI